MDDRELRLSLIEGHPLLPTLVSMKSKELSRWCQVRLALIDSIILQVSCIEGEILLTEQLEALAGRSNSEGFSAGTVEMESVRSNPGSL
jgi:hypothetical protein